MDIGTGVCIGAVMSSNVLCRLRKRSVGEFVCVCVCYRKER
jgi:hypothetical protein